MAATEVACDYIALDLKDARVAIQGFGAVGKHAARFLSQKGAILVAASDSSGTLSEPSGLDVASLIALKDAGRSLRDHLHGQKGSDDAILDVECDIWIPATRPDVRRSRSQADPTPA